ncbi:GroES-like protein [Aspergillus ruber CBS 135680]|uniref:GroES-like protein n=1 Tax=Aspergillus ruber (strain CBS 135680) TaxID=1388766 RepID=A0A017SCS9_ASPRC|nr:GroES-like protein [Aspergillus ruber CBS 135680]EYE94444.1 GroES-like protein [Aspergillus ruber CBS 135680]
MFSVICYRSRCFTIYQAKAPLVIEEIPIPEPSGRELRVRVKAASLCHSDLSIMSGDGPSEVRNVFPVILAMKPSPSSTNSAPKQHRMDFGKAISWEPPCGITCLNCNECKTAGPDFCLTRRSLGITRPGNFAEYTLIDPASAVLNSRPGVDPNVEILLQQPYRHFFVLVPLFGVDWSEPIFALARQLRLSGQEVWES